MTTLESIIAVRRLTAFPRLSGSVPHTDGEVAHPVGQAIGRGARKSPPMTSGSGHPARFRRPGSRSGLRGAVRSLALAPVRLARWVLA